MKRITISMPDSLRRQMRAGGQELNFSRIAREAIQAALNGLLPQQFLPSGMALMIPADDFTKLSKGTQSELVSLLARK